MSYDSVGAIIAFEQGDLGEEEVTRLIEMGLVTPVVAAYPGSHK